MTPLQIFFRLPQKKNWAAKKTCIGATIPIGQKIQCLPYVGFFYLDPIIKQYD